MALEVSYGLSTCYGIVTQSQGHITVDSAPGQGSTFRVCLPHAEGEARPVPVHSDSGQLPTGSEALLLVEDEPSVRGVSAQTLRLQGYTILEASNGVDALSVAGFS